MKNKISLNYIDFDNKETTALFKVLRSKHLERGEITRSTENFIKDFFNVKYAVLVNNGTSGLIASLKACNIGAGYEVITTPFTFPATVNAICLVGAKPIYADIDKETYNIDPKEIVKHISSKTKAILTVDLYGLPCDYDQINKIANKYNLSVISDSCQSLGAKYNNKYVLPNVKAQVFSFFGNKILTSGEGGLIITNNKTIADKVNLYINHGKTRGGGFKFINVGWNFRPTDIESAIVKSQFTKLKRIIKKRRFNAQYIYKRLGNIKGVILPRDTHNTEHAFSRYTIRIDKGYVRNRNKLHGLLESNNIECEVAYPKPLHLFKHLSFDSKKTDYPNAKQISNTVLTIPIHQNLRRTDLKYICDIISNT